VPEAAAAPEIPPVYIGPTPADPFGGGAFQLFDVVQQAEQQPLLPAPFYTPPLPLPEDPAAEPVEASVEPASIEPMPEDPTPEEPTEPAVKPFVIGADAPAAEKKRGWWRR
jgi:ribonuclease E